MEDEAGPTAAPQAQAHQAQPHVWSQNRAARAAAVVSPEQLLRAAQERLLPSGPRAIPAGGCPHTRGKPRPEGVPAQSRAACIVPGEQLCAAGNRASAPAWPGAAELQPQLRHQPWARRSSRPAPEATPPTLGPALPVTSALSTLPSAHSARPASTAGPSPQTPDKDGHLA